MYMCEHRILLNAITLFVIGCLCQYAFNADSAHGIFVGHVDSAATFKDLLGHFDCIHSGKWFVLIRTYLHTSLHIYKGRCLFACVSCGIVYIKEDMKIDIEHGRIRIRVVGWWKPTGRCQLDVPDDDDDGDDDADLTYMTILI